MLLASLGAGSQGCHVVLEQEQTDLEGERASFEEEKKNRDKSREMATDIIYWLHPLLN
jgi:hypothetical protein